MPEIVKIPLNGDEIITLRLRSFGDEEVDVEDLLRIQYDNLVGEQLTFPVILNRIGLLKAEQERIVATNKMDFEILKAQMYEEKKKLLSNPIPGETKVNKPTIGDIENAVLIDRRYRVRHEVYIKEQKHLTYIESIYFAAKDKAQKLNILFNKLIPQDFEKEIMEGSVNGVEIKRHEKLIKDPRKK